MQLPLRRGDAGTTTPKVNRNKNEPSELGKCFMDRIRELLQEWEEQYLTISNAGKTKDKHPIHMMKPRRPYLLIMRFLCAVCILVASLIGNWHSLNGERADSTEKAMDLNSNHGSGRFVANPDSQENPDRKVASYVLHAIGMPDRAKFVLCNGENTITFVAAGKRAGSFLRTG